MPKKTLTNDQRRELTLAALSGQSPTELARRYSVSRSYVYELADEARRNAKDEAEFWQQALTLMGGDRP